MSREHIRLLIVTAHPADSFDQAGGTLAHHVELGDRVTALMLTTGVRSHDWQILDARIRGENVAGEASVKQAAEKKEREVREACGILGIADLRFIEMEDDFVLLSRELVTAIARVIRDVRPHILVTSHPFEDGGVASAHATIGHAAVSAAHMAGGLVSGDESAPHRVAAIYFMNPLQGIEHVSMSVAVHGHVDLYVDITDVIEKKVRALDCIRSQHYHGWYSRKRAESEDGHWGVAATVPYAEAFQRHRPMVTRTLPLSDYEILKAQEPLAHHLGRYSHLLAHPVPLPADYTSPRPPQEYGLPE
jgi:LmbE family N-acetylglucosaminyl deacetylase